MAEKTTKKDQQMLETFQIEESDLQKLKRIAQNRGTTEKEALHELLAEAENQRIIQEDEQDPDEKAFNDAARSVFRSPEVQKKLAKIDKVLSDKNL